MARSASIRPPTDAPQLAAALDALRRGDLVGVPTETVYGVVARLDLPAAMRKLRALKGVGEHHVFAHHVADAAAAVALIDNPLPATRRLFYKALPGPVTFRMTQPGGSGGGGPRVIRCPDAPLTQALLTEAGGPVVGASATAAGQRPALTAEDAAAALGEAAVVVLDGGMSRFGRPSTLVDIRQTRGVVDFTVARPGVIDERMLRKMNKFNLLMVCTGNTCRSVMAEAIARELVGDRADVTISSAGVFAEGGLPANMEAQKAVEPLGLSLASHRSRPLTAELINAADQVFTMTESHRQAVLAQSPGMADKVQRLDPDADIVDPINRGAAVYQETLSQIRRALERRLKEQQL